MIFGGLLRAGRLFFSGVAMDRIIEEAISSLQAQVSVQHLVLLSVIKTHPDPAALLKEWRRVLTDAVDCKSALPSTSRHSEIVTERCEHFAEEWTAQLVDEAVDRSTHKPA